MKCFVYIGNGKSRPYCYFVDITVCNLFVILKQGHILYEKRSVRMLCQKGMGKKIKWIQSEKLLKFTVNTVFLCGLGGIVSLGLRFRLPVCLVCRSYHARKLGFSWIFRQLLQRLPTEAKHNSISLQKHNNLFENKTKFFQNAAIFF